MKTLEAKTRPAPLVVTSTFGGAGEVLPIYRDKTHRHNPGKSASPAYQGSLV